MTTLRHFILSLRVGWPQNSLSRFGASLPRLIEAMDEVRQAREIFPLERGS